MFLDLDGDGRRGAKEPGVADVKLSNGRDLVASDGEGRYRLPLRDGDTVFAIKPPSHRFGKRANGLPAFWRHHVPRGAPAPKYGGLARSRATRFDVPLIPTPPRAGELDVLLFGDPQPKTALHAGYYERDIVEGVLADADGGPVADLGITLGDIVDDDLALYPQMNRATARLGVPWLHVPGNHDLDFDVEHDDASLRTFRNVFGPDTYAWEEPGAAFIVLDDVIYRPGERPPYVGGLRDEQFLFLERYLATLDAGTRVVVAVHIPLFDVDGSETFRAADRRRLFALLQRFREPLILSAHSHLQEHRFHTAEDGWHGAVPLHEYNVGASCGGYWSGLPDARGIPDARMGDGTPNGYARLGLQHESYRMRWFPTGDDRGEHLRLSAPKVLRQGAYPAFSVSANVYMGLPDTVLEYRIDAGPWKPMRRTATLDPALVAINVADDLAPQLRARDRAVLAQASPHLWQAALPTDLAVGEHRIDVRAQGRWTGPIEASTIYRLEAWPDR